MAKINHKTAVLLREAMVLAFVEGARFAAEGRELPKPYPKDSEVVWTVLEAAQRFREIYPHLGRIDSDDAYCPTPTPAYQPPNT